MHRPAEPFRRARRWLLPAACAALLPKCVLCFLPGLALVAGGAELCGGSAQIATDWPTWVAGGGAAVLLLSLAKRMRRRTGY